MGTGLKCLPPACLARDGGSWPWLQGSCRQGSLTAVGFCISLHRQKSRRSDVGLVFCPACMPISKKGEGEGKWWFMFKNTLVPRAVCDSVDAFFSKAVSSAPCCSQPHSLLEISAFWGLGCSKGCAVSYLSWELFWF